MKQTKYRYHWLIVIVCCGFSAATLGLISNSNGVFFKPMADSLGVGIGSVTLFVTIANLVQAVTCPLVAWLLNKWDIRVLCSSFIILTLIALTLIAFTPNLYVLYISAVLLGIGMTGFSVIPINVLLANWFKDKLGLVVGITFSFSGIAGALFNPIFNNLIAAWGWRYTYLFMMVIIAVISLPGALLIRNKPSDLNLKPYGEAKTNTISEKEKGAPSGLSLITPVFIILILFGVFLNGVIGFGSHIPTYAVVIGLSSAIGASMMSYSMVSNVISKLVLGYLNDHLGIIKSLLIYSVFVILGVLGLNYLSLAPNLLQYLAPLGFGMVYAISTVGIPLLTKKLIGEKNFAISYSYINTFATIVNAVMLSLNGFLYDLTGTYQLSLMITLGCSIGVLGLLVIISKKKFKAAEA